MNFALNPVNYFQWNTVLGEMGAICSKDYLLGLFFLEDDMQRFEKMISHYHATPDVQHYPLQGLLMGEMNQYFSGHLKAFTVPYQLNGTAFQAKVWRALEMISFGQAITYQDQAHLLSHPKAVRAVAAANGKNPISVIVPCHRVIYKNGRLGGYAGGLWRKEWLLKHEKNDHHEM